MPREYDEARLHARRMKSMELRRKGFSYQDIVQELQREGWFVTVPQVYADVNREYRQRIKSEAEELDVVRRMEIDRLDVALKAITPRVEAGDDDAIHTMMKIMVRRAKLQGLDAATVKILDDKRLDRPMRDRGQLLSTLSDIMRKLDERGIKLLPVAQNDGLIEAEILPRTSHSAGQTANDSVDENPGELEKE